MTFNPLPLNEAVTNEILSKGRLHWDNMTFAPMEHFQPRVQDADTGMNIAVVDVNGNPTFVAIAEFAKTNLLSNTEPKQKTKPKERS